jgi:predicted dehydrogenase
VRDGRIRLGLVGLDHWYGAVALAEAAAARDDVELVAVADGDPRRAREIAQRFSIPGAESDIWGLAVSPDVDAIMSFVSTDLNPGVCVAAARAGKHVLSGKPLARTVAEAAEVARAVHESSVQFVSNESVFRRSEWYRDLSRGVRGGRLGTPLAAHCWFWAEVPQQWPGDPAPGWFADPLRTLGGAWADHGIYGIDLLLGLFGRGPARATGFTGKLRFPGLPVEDHGVATFALASGAIVTVESSWVAAAGSGFDFGLQVLGSHGAVRLAGKPGALSWEGEPDQALEQPGTGRPGQLEHFVSMIRNPEPAGRPDVDDACENVALALAFYEAAEAIAPPPPGS